MTEEHPDWWARNKDWITIVSSVGSMVAVGIAAWQFYLAREILEAEATMKALSEARSLIAQIERNPTPAARAYQASEEQILDRMFVVKTVSLFSQQYYSNKSGLLSDEHWNIMNDELCDFYRLPLVRPQIDGLLANNSYPEDFSNVLGNCR